jgi:hypothetical protein
VAAETIMGGDPVREWTTKDGVRMIGYAPYVHAVRDQLWREGAGDPSMEETHKRIAEYRSGERTPNDLIIAEIAKLESAQRADGYDQSA